MAEMECPFCDETCRVDPAAFAAEVFALRCEGCGVEVEFAKAAIPVPLARAA